MRLRIGNYSFGAIAVSDPKAGPVLVPGQPNSLDEQLPLALHSVLQAVNLPSMFLAVLTFKRLSV